MSDTSYKATGTVTDIRNEQVITDKFTKQEFVMTTPGDYPQHLIFEASNKRIETMDGLCVGDKIEVTFNLQGRCWEKAPGDVKVFITLSVWKIKVLKAEWEV